jgi:hypothetical protein
MKTKCNHKYRSIAKLSFTLHTKYIWIKAISCIKIPEYKHLFSKNRYQNSDSKDFN